MTVTAAPSVAPATATTAPSVAPATATTAPSVAPATATTTPSQEPPPTRLLDLPTDLSSCAPSQLSRCDPADIARVAAVSLLFHASRSYLAPSASRGAGRVPVHSCRCEEAPFTAE